MLQFIKYFIFKKCAYAAFSAVMLLSFMCVTIQSGHAGLMTAGGTIKYDSVLEAHETVWPDESLPSAIVEYWDVLVREGASSSFPKEAPYFQEMVSYSKYRNYVNLMGDVKALKYLEIFDVLMYTDNYCIVRMNIHITTGEGNVRVTGTRDHWIKVQGEWYHVIKNPLLFPDLS